MRHRHNLPFALAIPILLGGLVSCQNPTTQAPEAPSKFLFQTVASVSVEIVLPYEGAEVGLYSQGQRILQSRAVGSARIATRVDLPIVTTAVELRSSSFGLPSSVVVPVREGRVLWDYTQPTNREESSVSARSLAGGEEHRILVPYQTLGGWTSRGTPTYLDPSVNAVPAEVYVALNNLLPKGRSVMKRHPELLAPERVHRVVLNQASSLSLSFLHESAGYNNTIGYYAYASAEGPPAELTATDITLVFPSLRYAAHGGALDPGMQVTLGPFAAGTVVGLVLISNGFGQGNGDISRGFHWFTTDDGLNPDEPAYQRHAILTHLGEQGIIAFHDQMRDAAQSQDFNAAVLGIRGTVPGAVDWTDVVDLAAEGTFLVADDSLEEGPVSSNPDVGPAPALNTWISKVSLPAEGVFNTIAFEDCWPAKDDYDFNDLVVAYNFTQYLDSSGDVLRLVGQFQVRGVLASFDNGLAFELPVRPSAVQAVYGGHRLPSNPNWRYAPNGVESANDYAVINVFDESKVLYHPIHPTTVTVTVDFAAPVSAAALGVAPYNTFMLVDGERGREVHLPGQRPTRQAHLGYFGTKDDQTILGTDFTYQTADDLPWALVVPGNMVYPVDRRRVGQLYLHFDAWVENKGQVFADWYTDAEGYRDLAHAFF